MDVVFNLLHPTPTFPEIRDFKKGQASVCPILRLAGVAQPSAAQKLEQLIWNQSALATHPIPFHHPIKKGCIAATL